MIRKAFLLVLAISFPLLSPSAFANENSLLVQNFLNSFASRDESGLFQLINWDGVDRNTQNLIKKQIKAGFKGRQIRRIFIEPVPADINPSFEKDGKNFQLNVKPTGQLNIVYISNAGKRTTSQLFVGKHKGRLMIANPVEAPVLPPVEALALEAAPESNSCAASTGANC